MKVSKYGPTQAIVALVVMRWESQPRSAGPHGPVQRIESLDKREVTTLSDGRVEVRHKAFDGQDYRHIRRVFRRERDRVQQDLDSTRQAYNVCDGLRSEGALLHVLGDESLETTIKRTLGLPTGSGKL